MSISTLESTASVRALDAMWHAAAFRDQQLDESHQRTRAAVSAIKSIRGMTARDLCNLIEALHVEMERGVLTGDEANAAIEYLMDAHSIAERCAERQEAA